MLLTSNCFSSLHTDYSYVQDCLTLLICVILLGFAVLFVLDVSYSMAKKFKAGAIEPTSASNLTSTASPVNPQISKTPLAGTKDFMDCVFDELTPCTDVNLIEFTAPIPKSLSDKAKWAKKTPSLSEVGQTISSTPKPHSRSRKQPAAASISG